MKTTQDLMEEMLRHIFSGGGASPSEIEVQVLQFRQKFGASMKPRPLTDAEYARQLQQMKQEAPAFLDFLMNYQPPPPKEWES